MENMEARPSPERRKRTPSTLTSLLRVSLPQREKALAEYLNDSGDEQMMQLHGLLIAYAEQANGRAEETRHNATRMSEGRTLDESKIVTMPTARESCYGDVESVLRDFGFRPTIHPTFPLARGGPGYSLIPIRSPADFIARPLFALSMLELFQAGRLRRLRSCLNCKRWFVVSREQKIVCLDEQCRTKHEKQKDRERAQESRKDEKDDEKDSQQQAAWVLGTSDKRSFSKRHARSN